MDATQQRRRCFSFEMIATKWRVFPEAGASGL
jgi:hypothetical protein